MGQSGAPRSGSQVFRLLPYRGSVPAPAALSGPWGRPWGPLGCPGAAAECPASCWHPPLSPGEPSSASCGLSGPCTPWSLSLLVLSRWPQDEALLGQAPPPVVWGDGHSLQSYQGYFTEKPSLPAPGALGVGCVSRGWAPSRPAGQVPHFSSPQRAPQIRPKDCAERPPLCPSGETGCCWWWAAGEVSSAARRGWPWMSCQACEALVHPCGKPLRTGIPAGSRSGPGGDAARAQGMDGAAPRPRACSARPATSALSEASPVWFSSRRLGSWLKRRPPTAT